MSMRVLLVGLLLSLALHAWLLGFFRTSPTSQAKQQPRPVPVVELPPPQQKPSDADQQAMEQMKQQQERLQQQLAAMEEASQQRELQMKRMAEESRKLETSLRETEQAARQAEQAKQAAEQARAQADESRQRAAQAQHEAELARHEAERVKRQTEIAQAEAARAEAARAEAARAEAARAEAARAEAARAEAARAEAARAAALPPADGGRPVPPVGSDTGQLVPVLRVDWGTTENALRVLQAGQMKLVLVETHAPHTIVAEVTQEQGAWRPRPLRAAGQEYSNQLRIVRDVPAFAPVLHSVRPPPGQVLAVLVPAGVERQLQAAQLAAAANSGVSLKDLEQVAGRFDLSQGSLQFAVTQVKRRP